MRFFRRFKRSKLVVFSALFALLITANIYPKTIYRFNYRKEISKRTYQIERDVFKLINRERKKRGLKKLVLNARLSSLARRHSRDMARNNYFSHRNRSGRTVEQRAKNQGIRGWRSIGENLAYSYNSPKPAEQAVRSWMSSRGHRRNLLSSRWKETGIGIAVNRSGAYYFTEVFTMK